MQKKINFIKFNKIKAVFFGFIMLLFLIFTAERVVPTANSIQGLSFPVGESKYKQLEDHPLLPNWPTEELIEMNNLISKNANKPRKNIDLSGIHTVDMLDVATGTVKSLDLEYYTLCSLIAEMPLNFDSQALMAQAVACRTFAVRSYIMGDKHSNADICSDFNCCQSMRDADTCGFDITKAKEAVDATKGIIAVYYGEPIVAAYHASSVGYTNSSAEVWGGSLDYLVPVIAPENRENTKTTHYINAETVKSALRSFGLGNDIKFSTASDGLCSGAISESNYHYLSPKQIKQALNLRSSAFDIALDGTEYVINCYGFGHGVGMSQHGANALANQGYDFYEILKYYYTGIEFDFVNNSGTSA